MTVAPEGPGPVPVVVHWRPGCGYCARLLAGLEAHGLPHTRVDIWEDPDAAAWVRSVAGGNETVPTVRVGDRALVNPSVVEVAAALADALAAVPDGPGGASEGHC